MGSRLHVRAFGRLVAATVAVGATLCWLATGASAAPLAHGHTVHILKPGARANANQSNNWFGYNQGTLEQGGTQFHSITGDWTVPTATQHTHGQSESSSDWIGIGGGCVDASCVVGDNTLIQTGTEQDVDSSGNASYSAWWEIIPGPSISIDGMTVGPGDHMHADISETVSGSELWKITLQDVTRNESFTTTVPYPSTHATAEWIEETPLIIGTGAGLAPLPNLTNTAFDLGTVNGAPVQLKPSEEIQLTDQSNKVIGTPSAPDSDVDGFGLCAWATACAVPGS
ncbi:MAG TPA: G1 family glutamic endopeptidase [Solirubrobacterales bacterium]|nr:G1 family glutamic endopeptidase [Solirubrobacterales bacterium]